MREKISLCLIVKPDDREAEYLDECLKSIAPYVDEICITITGKNKKVEGVAKKYNAKISYFKWINDFASARNFNFSQASGDWILWCDADDVIEGGEKLREYVEKLKEVGGDAIICDYYYDFDQWGNCTVKHKKTRVVKNDGCVKWEGMLHEDLIPQRVLKQFYVQELKFIHKSKPERKEEAKRRNLEIALYQLEKRPEDPKCLWDVANAHLSLGNYQQAIEFYQKFIEKSNSDEEKFLAFHRMAECERSLGNYERALDWDCQALKLRPHYPDPYLGMGETYFLMRKFKEAREMLVVGLMKEVPEDTAIVWNPRDYDFNPLMLLAKVYFELKQPEKSKICLQKCLEIYPNREDLKNTIKLLDEEIRKLKEIDKIYEKAMQAKTKEEIKKLIDSVPEELQSHPKLVCLRNAHFVKEKSSGRDLVIYCPYVSEQFNPEIVFKEGRGGSEEAVCHMSKRLAKLGWNVVVYANCGYKEKIFDGVIWRPWWTFNPRDKNDILIVWRHPMLYEMPEIGATKKYVWLHDILKENEFTKQRLKNIDKIIVLSKWQRNLFPNIPDEKFLISGNGIDIEMFERLDGKIKRNPYRLIYTSSYDRGLKTLLELFPFIKKEIPQAELHIFYGWNVFDLMYEGNKKMMEYKKEVLRLLKQDGVFEHGRVSQERIIEEYFKSSIWAYPTEFGEISCISAMKAQAAGCIPVTTNVAALEETVQFGLKIDSQHIYSDIDAQTEFVEGIINILKNPPTEKEREEMKAWARVRFNWDNVAKQWDDEFRK